jgi:hypothetical protein
VFLETRCDIIFIRLENRIGKQIGRLEKLEIGKA